MTEHVILASGSPRRRELFDQVGVRYRTQVAEIDEASHKDEPAGDYVMRIAEKKARWVAGQDSSGLPVVGADTAVVLDGNVLGKPGTTSIAASMLKRLSGRTHEVYTGVALVSLDGRLSSCLSISRVSIGKLNAEWINAYCATGEPLDKAGAYAIQGMAARYISNLEGSYSGVMGLPLFETMELIQSAGIELLPGVNVK
jgi:septum formation protein